MSRYFPKGPTFLLSLVPAVYIGYQIWLAITGQPNGLGPDPGKAIEHSLGQWGLRFLLISLAVTPIRQISGWTQVARLRRMLGLFAFFYIALHLASYLVFMQQLNLNDVLHDIAKHPYVLVGFAAFCAMVPLAAASNSAGRRFIGWCTSSSYSASSTSSG
jgi:methionine sulfoxide reductase heme-binding subunit